MPNEPGERPRLIERITAQNPRWGGLLGLLASLGVHALAAGYLSHFTLAEPFEIEFAVPAEIEFGLTDEIVGKRTAVAPAAPPPTPPKAVEQDIVVPDDQKKSPPKDEAKPPSEPAAKPDPSQNDKPATGEQSSDEDSDYRVPPGAQIALRINMERVRTSPAAEDVQRLLKVLPDWHAILDGSGVEPTEDLNRLLIATPNLRRSRLILAGEHARAEGYVREVQQKFAASRGESSSFRVEHGVPTAPWPNRDRTRRVISIIGPKHFAITRPEDLDAVLAVAQARGTSPDSENNNPSGDRSDASVETAAFAALVAMNEHEVVSLEVESAKQFAIRRAEYVPERFQLSIEDRAQRVLASSTGRFSSEKEAAQAKTFWNAVRDRYARNPFVALTGLDTPLRRTSIEQRGRSLHFSTTLSYHHLRLLLGYLEGFASGGANRRRPQNTTHPPPRPL